jgi:EAL domain-containing protein (putative c-di-GMP-specific phosphodiesterase class I)
VIVKSTIELARNLGLRTVAEGIEDAATLERLVELGVELAQGYHLSRPLPAAELLCWWDAHTRSTPVVFPPMTLPTRASATAA